METPKKTLELTEDSFRRNITLCLDLLKSGEFEQLVIYDSEDTPRNVITRKVSENF